MIGWTPEQVDRMTVSQFHAAVTGYIKAHQAEQPDDLDIGHDEYAQILAQEMAAGRA